MSEEEIQQTILRAINARTEARKTLLTIDRTLTEIGRQMVEVGNALQSPSGRVDLLAEDILLRKLRELPDATRISSLVAERSEVSRRIDEASEYLRRMGIEPA